MNGKTFNGNTFTGDPFTWIVTIVKVIITLVKISRMKNYKCKKILDCYLVKLKHCQPREK